ncbi:NUDIX domain-containing protein [Halolamina sp. R1-12]|nr:NUDIX domain-containing protein [Halolamina sp. R1-12]
MNAVPAVDVVVLDGDSVLLMNPVSKADWEFPGGNPEADEEPIDAAVCELAEETGIEADASDVELLTVTHSEHLDRHYNLITYLLEYERAGGTLTAGVEAEELEFWTIDRILSSPTETRQVDRDVLRSTINE